MLKFSTILVVNNGGYYGLHIRYASARVLLETGHEHRDDTAYCLGVAAALPWAAAGSVWASAGEARIPMARISTGV
ncbi:protein of unknown function [Acidithiobacillus ferrivorans]|uniref:Uncharacterized protein n=1 Tax=Acidithiobacillus ferrivorans TaxID=160808 RepID=A0A060UR95_9PROT|nr:hypothetical protein AFERRI_420124 [Acidithiobacillus ferrivorans]SMH65966.1 protein of unknown function [Acidithiobacillus ferrivorans]